MSALSTPGGGGTTAQSKPTSGKQKYQKLDINSLYCANRNENSEPSSVKSQLSRKHGMQSLGKVPSARRPPANLPSLKTETGQDPNANSVSTVSATVTTQATCTSQTITTSSSSGVVAGTGSGGWVPLPPPSSPHFRTEFPSLEAAAQPSHRSSDHSALQPQLRPQTEGSWTCGGTAGVRQETISSPGAAPASTPATQQTPAFRAILPSFLMKGSSGTGIGLGTLSSLRDNRNSSSGGGNSSSNNSNMAGSRQAPRQPATPRAVEVLTARPILREDQISSLDDISRDAGWAQHDDIDYDQKLDFSDGESSTPTAKSNKNNNRTNMDNECLDNKIQDPGDEEQIWAERRQKQSNEVAQAVARARQRKEEEQRRQMRDSPAIQQQSKDTRDKNERSDRTDNRDKESEVRDKDNRVDNKERERCDNKDKERNDVRERDSRDKDRLDRERDRVDPRDRFDRERERDRDRDRLQDNKDRNRLDNRDRADGDKDRELRDRDRNDNRDRNDRDRMDRDRYDRERDRDRVDRDRGDRDRDRDRDFRDRDRDYARERDRDRDREQSGAPFSKTFQANIPPRFLRQQQSRQHKEEDQHKAWAFTGKPAPRRQEPAPYNASRHTSHNGRRSYSRDYSDREDEIRRDKDGPGPQWRSEMQDYERSGRELDRSNSKDSYKDFNDYKDRRSDSDRKSIDSAIENSNRTAADKLTEVFERKSIGLAEPFATSDLTTQQQERRTTPSSNSSQCETIEKDFSKTSWADVAQEEQNSMAAKLLDKDITFKQIEHKIDPSSPESMEAIITSQQNVNNSNSYMHTNLNTQNQTTSFSNNHIISTQVATPQIQQTHTVNTQINHQTSVTITSVTQSQPTIFADSHTIAKSSSNQSLTKSINSGESMSSFTQSQKPSEQISHVNTAKSTISVQKSEKDLSESESIASKSSTDPSQGVLGNKIPDTNSVENTNDSQKRSVDDKKNEKFNTEILNKVPIKEPVERKSSGSGSEKKGRGFGSSGYNVYSRGWGSRESRGRRSHRSSRSNNRASESDGSTDGNNIERKERRRAPRSPRGPKKQDRPDETNTPTNEQGVSISDGLENREPFAPRGQPSRRGRGGFQGTNRPPAPAKRVTGYGPPNTKSPFSQANRAVKDNEDVKDNLFDDKEKSNQKSRPSSTAAKGRDRRSKGGPMSGEDENWETTSEHSESGGAGMHRRPNGGRQPAQSQKGQIGNRNNNSINRQNVRGQQAPKKEGDSKSSEVTEAINDLKISTGKNEDIVDDGFQEVRNKKNSKETRVSNVKDEKPPRSRSNQGGGRNGSSSRSSNDKSNTRGTAPVAAKSSTQYDRPRQANLAPRFVKQRQKQQMGISTFGPDTGAAPPPPPVNAWDKPISQTLRGNTEEAAEVTENKSNQSSQRSSPGDTSVENKPPVASCTAVADKSGVLDGATPPVETIIFENTNYKTAPPAEALKQKYQPSAATAKTQADEVQTEMESRPLPFNGDVRSRPRSIQELMAETGRPVSEAEGSLGLQMSFDTSQKTEDSSDMKLDFAFDSDLSQLTEDKSAKSLGLPRGTHMSTSNTISPLAADLNLKIASVKKVWEMPAVAEGSEELQFAGFEETNTETGAPPNVCKVKPTQQLQSPPPQHYNHVSYQGGYGGLSVPSPPAVLFNSSQQMLGSSQQLQQQGGLYGAFLDQTRGQFGGFPGTPYGAGSATPYNYQPPPDMFQSLPNQYRMAAAAGGGAAFGQSGQLGNSPSTVLISSTSNSLMSATVKPSTQQIGAIGSKGAGVGGVGGVGGVNTFQQQYLGYSGPVGEAPYSLPGLLPRPAPPATSYYSPYQPPAAPAPTYPLQFTQPAQSSAFSSQYLSSQLHVAAAAAVQQMQSNYQQQQYRAPPLQQQYAPQPRPPPQQQLKSPLHEHANGFAPLCDSASPTPKGANKPQKPPHSPPQHKYHAPPPHQQHPQHPQHPPPAHTPHQHHQQHQQQLVGGGNNGRGGNVTGGGNGSGMNRGNMVGQRYPAPIQRPHAPAMPMYRAPPAQAPRAHHAPRANLYYHHHQRNGGSGPERVADVEVAASVEDGGDGAPAGDAPPVAEVKAE